MESGVARTVVQRRDNAAIRLGTPCLGDALVTGRSDGWRVETRARIALYALVPEQ